MAKKKLVSVAFKADEQLAELLNQLPNKSDFIRKAIASQMSSICPLCKGKGIVPRGIHNHFEPLIREHRQHACATCGTALLLPEDPAVLNPEDRARL